jgi:NCAIR mutase (PurE)-related protein
MDEPRLRALLVAVASGATPIESAMSDLKHFALHDLGRIQLDHHRSLRQGFPEVIYGAGKSTEDLARIVATLLADAKPLIVTRLASESALALRDSHPDLHYDPESHILFSDLAQQPMLAVQVLVIAAGTADLPVATEAATIARLAGCHVETLWDCGVAGIHRLTSRMELLENADILIVVAGMEGALPSVVGGLTDKPLIAVPTSTGYGTGLDGYAAMLTMLNSCAAGTVVVNIDNGFGAGCFAGMLGRQLARREPST